MKKSIGFKVKRLEKHVSSYIFFLMEGFQISLKIIYLKKDFYGFGKLWGKNVILENRDFWKSWDQNVISIKFWGQNIILKKVLGSKYDFEKVLGSKYNFGKVLGSKYNF